MIVSPAQAGVSTSRFDSTGEILACAGMAICCVTRGLATSSKNG